MMCLFVDLSLFAGRGVSRRRRVNPQVHTNFVARPDLPSNVRAVVRTFCDLYRDNYSNPTAAALPRRCQPLVMRSSRHRFVMRLTGDASDPYLAYRICSGDFVCRSFVRLIVIGHSFLALRRRLTEPLAPGFVGDATSRVDSVSES
jgi:hypothetical protein